MTCRDDPETLGHAEGRQLDTLLQEVGALHARLAEVHAAADPARAAAGDGEEP